MKESTKRELQDRATALEDAAIDTAEDAFRASSSYSARAELQLKVAVLLRQRARDMA